MLIIGIVLSFVVLAYLCWLLFTLAVNALPFFVGVTAGFATYHSWFRADRRDHRRPDREQHHLRCRADRLHNDPLAAHPGSNRTPLRGAGCRRGISRRARPRTNRHTHRGLAAGNCGDRRDCGGGNRMGAHRAHCPARYRSGHRCRLPLFGYRLQHTTAELAVRRLKVGRGAGSRIAKAGPIAGPLALRHTPGGAPGRQTDKDPMAACNASPEFPRAEML